MPSSGPDQINHIIKAVIELNPQSVLDIGPGYGKYGLLCREYSEIWKNIHHKSRVRIDAIEAFSKYISPVHRHIYNKIYVGNARSMIKKLSQRYELILLIDVIEHFEKKDGMEFLKDLKEKGRFVLVSTPKKYVKQDALFSNDYEIHKSVWSKKELDDNGASIKFNCKNSLIVLLGSKSDISDFRAKLRSNKIKSVITKIPFVVRLYKSWKGR